VKNTSKKLLEKTKEIWEEYYTHPFTMGIADETLDIEKFKFYMIQDYLYLIDYAKVFALGVAKSDDMQAAKRFAKALDLIYNGEMDIHRGYMKRLGISLEEAENTPVAIDNASYTSYMLKVAYEQGIAEIASAEFGRSVAAAGDNEFIAFHGLSAAFQTKALLRFLYLFHLKAQLLGDIGPFQRKAQHIHHGVCLVGIGVDTATFFRHGVKAQLGEP